jgi:ribosome-associated protein
MVRAEIAFSSVVTVPGSALRFSFSRSSGPGGQNVNKVNSRVELRVSVSEMTPPSGTLSESAAARLRAIAGSRLNSSDEIVIASDTFRTQSANRRACVQRLRGLVERALVVPKKRRPTSPTRGSVERRISEKKRRAQIKANRGTTRRGGDDE